MEKELGYGHYPIPQHLCLLFPVGLRPNWMPAGDVVPHVGRQFGVTNPWGFWIAAAVKCTGS